MYDDVYTIFRNQRFFELLRVDEFFGVLGFLERSVVNLMCEICDFRE